MGSYLYYVGLGAVLDGSWREYPKPVVYKCSNYQTWNTLKFQRCLILFKNGCKVFFQNKLDGYPSIAFCNILLELYLKLMLMIPQVFAVSVLKVYYSVYAG